jgi:hypothetical protein
MSKRCHTLADAVRQAPLSGACLRFSSLPDASRPCLREPVYYRLADATVFQLCDMMCGRIEAELKTRRKLFA